MTPIDDEQIEESLYEANLVKNVLGMDLEGFKRYRSNITKGLIKFGGSFNYHLGILLKYADVQKSVKIVNVWSKECNEHEMLYRIYIAKKKADDKLLQEDEC